MIDWKTCKCEDFEIQIMGEETHEGGSHMVFVVNVHHKTEGFAFPKSISIRGDFYHQIKKRDDAVPRLKEILRTRCKDEIEERIKTGMVSVDHKLELISEKRESL